METEATPCALKKILQCISIESDADIFTSNSARRSSRSEDFITFTNTQLIRETMLRTMSGMQKTQGRVNIRVDPLNIQPEIEYARRIFARSVQKVTSAFTETDRLYIRPFILTSLEEVIDQRGIADCLKLLPLEMLEKIWLKFLDINMEGHDGFIAESIEKEAILYGFRSVLQQVDGWAINAHLRDFKLGKINKREQKIQE